MKKLTICISLLFSFILTSEALANEQISVNKNNVQVFINNTKISNTNFLYKDTIYLPLRTISEALGASVNYDGISSIVSIHSDSQSAFGIHSSSEYEKLYRNFQVLLYSKKINDNINGILSLADTTTIDLYSSLNNDNGLTVMKAFDNAVEQAVITYNEIYNSELAELYEAAEYLKTVAVSINDYGNILTDLRFNGTSLKNSVERKDTVFTKMYEAKLKSISCIDDIVLNISKI